MGGEDCIELPQKCTCRCTLGKHVAKQDKIKGYRFEALRQHTKQQTPRANSVIKISYTGLRYISLYIFPKDTTKFRMVGQL